jgi:hypothetical protein
MPLQQVKGITADAAKGVMIEHFLGQGADERFAGELEPVLVLGLGEDIRDMKGAIGRSEYVLNNCNIRLRLSRGWRGTVVTPVQGTQGSELALGGNGEYIEQIVSWRCGVLPVFSCHGRENAI